MTRWQNSQKLFHSHLMLRPFDPHLMPLAANVLLQLRLAGERLATQCACRSLPSRSALQSISPGA